MYAHSENESWVIHRGGDIVEKKARGGVASLNTWERLLYCLWVTDYMMRNAGDFANAAVMYPEFQSDANRFAQRLSLPVTCEAFSLSRKQLQRQYLDRFEAVYEEQSLSRAAVRLAMTRLILPELSHVAGLTAPAPRRRRHAHGR